MVRSANIPGTVKNFLTILVGRLTRYDKLLQQNALKKGRPDNIYRLSLWLGAKQEAEQLVHSYLNESTPEALNALKAALIKKFHVNDMPPVKAVIKMIDEFIASGKSPKYASANRLVDRFLGLPPFEVF